MLINCTERTGRTEEKKETLLSLLPPFSFPLSSLFQLCSAAPTFICCHSYRGAVHFFCSDLVRCSTCHLLPPRLTIGRSLSQSRAEPSLKSPLLSEFKPLVFLLVSIVCVSSTWWQYLWYLLVC